MYDCNVGLSSITNEEVKNMDNTYYNQQMENKEKAIKAINDYIDCLIYATPEFREQIGKESFTLFVAKSKLDPQLNNVLNSVFGIENLVAKFQNGFSV